MTKSGETMGRKIERNEPTAQPDATPGEGDAGKTPLVEPAAAALPVTPAKDAPVKDAPVKEKGAPRPPKPVATVADAEIEAIVGGYHGAPYDVLGPHVITANGKEVLAVRAFRPLDSSVDLLNLEDGKRTPMKQVHPGGLFEALFPTRKRAFPYLSLIHI